MWVLSFDLSLFILVATHFCDPSFSFLIQFVSSLIRSLFPSCLSLTCVFYVLIFLYVVRPFVLLLSFLRYLQALVYVVFSPFSSACQSLFSWLIVFVLSFVYLVLSFLLSFALSFGRSFFLSFLLYLFRSLFIYFLILRVYLYFFRSVFLLGSAILAAIAARSRSHGEPNWCAPTVSERVCKMGCSNARCKRRAIAPQRLAPQVAKAFYPRDCLAGMHTLCRDPCAFKVQIVFWKRLQGTLVHPRSRSAPCRRCDRHFAQHTDGCEAGRCHHRHHRPALVISRSWAWCSSSSDS